MSESISLKVNGKQVAVPADATVAVAIALAGAACRKSVTGELRGPLCGMGICFECRAVIDGIPHCRSCQILCASGMEVRTDE
jgi:aerobic-type carbon monoxide dehydrogenase small subunit (CoxS/CutS family)